MATDSHIHHEIDYIEFAVKDMEQSKKFYNSAFGWQFTDYAPDYVGIQKNGGEAGGFRLDPEVVTGGPLAVLYSQNIKDSYKKVSNAGGKISKEIFEFPGGCRFQFLDPNGNELAVWSKTL